MSYALVSLIVSSDRAHLHLRAHIHTYIFHTNTIYVSKYSSKRIAIYNFIWIDYDSSLMSAIEWAALCKLWMLNRKNMNKKNERTNERTHTKYKKHWAKDQKQIQVYRVVCRRRVAQTIQLVNIYGTQPVLYVQIHMRNTCSSIVSFIVCTHKANDELISMNAMAIIIKHM